MQFCMLADVAGSAPELAAVAIFEADSERESLGNRFGFMPISAANSLLKPPSGRRFVEVECPTIRIVKLFHIPRVVRHARSVDYLETPGRIVARPIIEDSGHGVAIYAAIVP